MKKYIFLVWSCLFFACGDDGNSIHPKVGDILSEYIEDNLDFPLVRDSLIACAAGGAGNASLSSEKPISIFFYPEGNASNYQYFETESINVDPDDLSKYENKSLTDLPLFNGYLRYFLRESIDENIWCRVTYVKDDRLHISNAIRLKYNDLPTEFNTSLLEINQDEKLSPIFSWEDGNVAENAIYFQVISDAENDLLSGTYTYDKHFQFYNLENVVLNIRNINPDSKLKIDEGYSFLMMGVSSDNWVNLIIEEPFDTR